MANVVVVFGATGTQGGSVLRALLKDKKNFTVRAVTRNAESPKAKALAALGVEVVQASLDDASTLSSAVEGCHGVFGVTNSWEHMNSDREIQQGKDLVDACKAAGVKHLVFSLLENVEDAIGVKCPHFDAKGVIEKYMFESGVPCTSVRYSFYMENIIGMMKPQRQYDGGYQLVIPMGDQPMDMVSSSAAGQAVAAIFRCPTKYLGRAIGLTGDKKTVAEYAKILNKYLSPKKFKATDMPLDQYSRLGFPGADDLAAMFDFYRRGNPDRNLKLTWHLDPGMPSFEEWVKANKDAINESLESQD
ncbi:nmrA-like family domain-containing protein 1 [Amphiura filiformis]|uniref:nmrA-like family domain-containing protein 1 n=1 Tax=Amphiura filiformis TaxID=82378 RepID=UPI003B20BB3A